MPLQPYDHDHENEVTLLAETNFRNRRTSFGIKTDDRRRHVYVIGKTGMGKTTMLENMVLADINAGHGLAYIDPHGDTAQKLLDFIPPNRINDVIYVNPGDMDFPIGFNILETVDPDKKHLVAAGLMGVFKKIWPDVWSPRMEYILLNSILALLDAPGSTLLGIARILVDEEYRKRVVSLIQDPVVKTFWVKEFASFSEKYRTEAIAPIQNKVGQFLSASIIRNIVAQVKSTIDIRGIMDQRKILILNLAKGLIGEENSRLLGGMIVTRLQLAAMERADMPEKDRQDFYLYVDEFQNFATTSFANIMSEARKYRLNLIVAHQYIEQLTHGGDTDIRDAIFGNVGTIVSFRVGAADAEFMETEFMPQFTPEDLVNLGKYDIYIKLMIDGAASAPFSATTLAPIAQRTGSMEKVIRVSRERYGQKRAKIEENVLRWSGMGTVDEGMTLQVEEEVEAAETAIQEKIKSLEASSPKISGPAPKEGKLKPQFEIACSVCGKMQKLTFEPDRSRPWFCKEDMEKRRLEMETRRGDAPGPVQPAQQFRPAGEARPAPPRPSVVATGPAPSRPSVAAASLTPARAPAVAVGPIRSNPISTPKFSGPPPKPFVKAPPSVAPGLALSPKFSGPPPKPFVKAPPAAAAGPIRSNPAPNQKFSGPPPAAAPSVKPISLASLFGKNLSVDAPIEIIEEDDAPDDEAAPPEIKPRPDGGAGLVAIAKSSRSQLSPSPVNDVKSERPPSPPPAPPKASASGQPPSGGGQVKPTSGQVAVKPPSFERRPSSPIEAKVPVAVRLEKPVATGVVPVPTMKPAPPAARPMAQPVVPSSVAAAMPAVGAKLIRPGEVIKF